MTKPWTYIPTLKTYSGILLMYLYENHVDTKAKTIPRKEILDATGLCKQSYYMAVDELVEKQLLSISKYRAKTTYYLEK